jgi:co-chaperonin GroES (HSP10)
MKPLNNRVILKLEERMNNRIKLGDFDFQIDTDFRQFHNAMQKATVEAAPIGTELEHGDVVYVHHFVADRENRLPFKNGHYSWIEYANIYCKIVDGKPVMLNNWMFVEPVMADNQQFFDTSKYGIALNMKQGSDYLDRVGIARHLSQSAKDAGISEGDKILFGKNCEYDIKIEGTLFYRMDLVDIITILDDEVRLQSVV